MAVVLFFNKHQPTGGGIVMGLLLSLLLLLVHASSSSSDDGYVEGIPHNQVVTLDRDNYDDALKDPANSLWFLKFYAPWCGHCKRLAPVLDSVAPKLNGKMAIGKIDCTIEKKLCDRYKVRGYPTLKFALDGDVYDYPGSRDEASIIQFATKMSAPAVNVVTSIDPGLVDCTKQAEEGVAFVGYDVDVSLQDDEEQVADTSKQYEKMLQSTTVSQVFSQVARKKKAFGHFCWLTPNAEGIDKLSTASKFVARMEEGVAPKFFDIIESSPAITTDALLEFVAAENIATVSILGPHNFQKVGHNGRPLVIGVVETDNVVQLQSMKKELTTYVTATGPKDIVDQYYFAIIDLKRWHKFLKQFNINENDDPQVFVLDVPTKKFWQNSTYDNVSDFLAAVADGTITSGKSSSNKATGFLGKLEDAFLEFFPYSMFGILAVVVLIVVVLIPPASDRPPYENPEFDPDLTGGDDAAAAGQTTDAASSATGGTTTTTTKPETKKDK